MVVCDNTEKCFVKWGHFAQARIFKGPIEGEDVVFSLMPELR